jgi:hypothetical protein
LDLNRSRQASLIKEADLTKIYRLQGNIEMLDVLIQEMKAISSNTQDTLM